MEFILSNVSKKLRGGLNIKALILAAGYATRLYPLTENQAKPLLEVGGKPIIEHILDNIKKVKVITEVLVVTNARFHHDFEVWLNHYNYPKKIKIINDGTINNTDRLGAVGDINFVLKEEEIKDDLLVIAGDNLFGFSLEKFISFYKQLNKSGVALFNIKDKEKIRKKLGVGILNGTKIIEFQEKPVEPKSTFAATACYYFVKNDLNLVKQAVEKGYADNSGDLIRYLVKTSEAHGYVFSEHWFDIGSPESLTAAKEVYK